MAGFANLLRGDVVVDAGLKTFANATLRNGLQITGSKNGVDQGYVFGLDIL